MPKRAKRRKGDTGEAVTDAVDAHKYSVGDRVEAEFVERVSVVGCVWGVGWWRRHPVARVSMVRPSSLSTAVRLNVLAGQASQAQHAHLLSLFVPFFFNFSKRCSNVLQVSGDDARFWDQGTVLAVSPNGDVTAKFDLDDAVSATTHLTSS
jgi:hypothetical protein